MTETFAVGDQVKDVATGVDYHILKVGDGAVYGAVERWHFAQKLHAAQLVKVPPTQRPTPVDSYLAMAIERQHQHACTMIWTGTEWMERSQCEQQGFRAALKLTSRDAWALRAAMLATGFFGKDYGYNPVQITVKRLDSRAIYVFYDWDKEEGTTGILGTIRADGWWAAKEWFKASYPNHFQTDRQVLSLSDCQHDADKIAQLDLLADLINV